MEDEEKFQTIQLTKTPTAIVSCCDKAEELRNEIGDKLDKILEEKLPTQYIFLNKSLNMTSGKAAAQVAHAVEELTSEIYHHGDGDTREKYFRIMAGTTRVTIILAVKDADELYKLNNYLESQGIWTGIYVDECCGEEKFVPTALAVNYLDRCDVKTKIITGMFEKFSSSLEMKAAKYKETLIDIESMALDSYYGRLFGSKQDLLNIYNKSKEVTNEKA